MAFQGNGLTTKSGQNYFSFNARNSDEGKLPHISELLLGSEHTYIIDSRNRDLRHFPDPSVYDITLEDGYKNVTSIELKGSILPKSEYNVNSSNNIIPFNLEDNVTSINIKDKGYGYTDGVYTAGDADLSIPAISGGTQATITVTVTNNVISNVVITDSGTGYLRGYYGANGSEINGFYKNTSGIFIDNIPRDSSLSSEFRSATLEVVIGNLLLAKLNYGQYEFSSPNDSNPGLCREVTRALQQAVDDAIANGTLVPVVGGPSNGAEYFPYATTDNDEGSCFLSTPNSNASPNNRVNIQKGKNDGSYNQSLFLELLWHSVGEYKVDYTSRKLLGFGSYTYITPFPPIDQTSGELSTLVATGAWTSEPVTARNDYNLLDHPDYVILEVSNSNVDFDRIESNNEQLEKSYAVCVFDATNSNVVWRSAPATTPPSGTGDSDIASLSVSPGQVKPIKGADFDSKKISFSQPISELNSFRLEFKKPNGEYYNFQGRDHLLIIQIAASDVNTGNRF